MWQKVLDCASRESNAGPIEFSLTVMATMDFTTKPLALVACDDGRLSMPHESSERVPATPATRQGK
jgi:hypothetical protein